MRHRLAAGLLKRDIAQSRIPAPGISTNRLHARHFNTCLPVIQQGVFDHRPTIQENLECGCAALIPGLKPNYLGRLTPDKRKLFKIRIPGDDDKTFILRKLPDLGVSC